MEKFEYSTVPGAGLSVAVAIGMSRPFSYNVTEPAGWSQSWAIPRQDTLWSWT